MLATFMKAKGDDQMKKLLVFLLTFSLMFALAACNQKAEDVSGEKDGQEMQEQNNQEEQEKPEGNQEEQSNDLTLEEVYNKTIEASNSLKSFTMTTDLEMVMNSNLEPEPLNMTTNMTGQIVTEPMAMYQQMSTSLAGAEQSFSTEMYVTEEGFYFLEPAGNTWIKMPTEMSAQMLGEAANQQANPGAELAKLQKFVSDFEFQKDETQYILILTADGEKFVDFANEMLQSTMPQEFANAGDIFANMSIENLQYEIYIDQKTFFPTKLNMNIKMTVTEGEETVTMDMKMNGSYSEFNNVSVQVPQEVIDNAQEMNAETGM